MKIMMEHSDETYTHHPNDSALPSMQENIVSQKRWYTGMPKRMPAERTPQRVQYVDRPDERPTGPARVRSLGACEVLKALAQVTKTKALLESPRGFEVSKVAV
jgi:hypothetical protein